MSASPLDGGLRLGQRLALSGRLLVGLALVAALFSLGLPDVTSMVISSGRQPATLAGSLFQSAGGQPLPDEDPVVIESVAPSEPAPSATAERDCQQSPPEQCGGAGVQMVALGLSAQGLDGSPTSTPIATPTPSAPRAPEILSYTVREGDTLLGLALKYQITPETILWANDLGNGELIWIGQELTIPPVSGVLHTVKNGDTVAGIAEAYMADPEAIVAANQLKAGAGLLEGKRIVVPDGVMRTTEPITALPAPPSADELAKATKYTVKPGDNLGSIADSFGLLPSVIQVANELMNPDMLQVGQELVIPSDRTAAAQAAPSRPNPTAAPAPTETPPPPPPTRVPSPEAPKYTIKAGDTLYSIANAYRVKVSDIQAANGLNDESRLQIGQQLSIPGGSASPAPVRTSAPQPIATPQPAAPTVAPTAVSTAVPTAARTAAPAAAPAKPAQPTASAPAPPPLPAGSPRGAQIAAISQKYLGFRYIWGGASPNGFDCSGFTWYVYREAGITIPRDLGGQLNSGSKVPREQLQPGDLVFFQNTYAAGLSHSGIFLGGGRFINAETEKVGVVVRSLSDPYWSARFIGASRPW